MRNSTQRAVGAAFLAIAVLAPTHAAVATNTVGCSAKMTWRNEVVETLVKSWYRNNGHTDDLLDLIQAEQGLTACNLGKAQTTPLHTSTLSRDLQLEELGGLLLANELQWARLLPEPEEGLSGRSFQVFLPSVQTGIQ